MSKPKQCCDCRAGEHENYDDDVRYITIRNPDNGRMFRGWVCAEHRQMYRDDGFVVTVDAS